MFPFGGVAKQSLAKLRNNQVNIRQLIQRCSRKKLCLNFCLPKDNTLNECDDFLLCFVLLGSVLQCCLHDVEFSEIVPGCKRFFLFFLIPDGLRCGLFAEKMQQNDVLFGIAILSGNI